ncbi:hypothetical protein RHMOL_Rhmol08G0251800 [Rhododendron molle]|uniref:Uncharacterized protein n=1 Tax=Rhododendron molle TaxID=49168 RepID=A0ACC0MSA2_RHOML|nr:hypothetical protein RHMOL_Rhmol08G0251800 [Rhododendron molle]
MTSFCGGGHTISTNKREGNVHPLLRRVNKIALRNRDGGKGGHVPPLETKIILLYFA